jgi:hypothetical protein
MSIKQFSAIYSLLEDRIIFSFNTSDSDLYTLLLTRTTIKSLLHQSDQVIELAIGTHHNERSSKLISEFQKDGLKKQLNFKESFDGGSKAPLGRDPILVSGICLALIEGTVSISITLVSNQVLRFHLLPMQLQALALLFEKLAHEASWQIIPADASQAMLGINVSSPIDQVH